MDAISAWLVQHKDLLESLAYVAAIIGGVYYAVITVGRWIAIMTRWLKNTVRVEGTSLLLAASSSLLAVMHATVVTQLSEFSPAAVLGFAVIGFLLWTFIRRAFSIAPTNTVQQTPVPQADSSSSASYQRSIPPQEPLARVEKSPKGVVEKGLHPYYQFDRSRFQHEAGYYQREGFRPLQDLRDVFIGSCNGKFKVPPFTGPVVKRLALDGYPFASYEAEVEVIGDKYHLAMVLYEKEVMPGKISEPLALWGEVAFCVTWPRKIGELQASVRYHHRGANKMSYRPVRMNDPFKFRMRVQVMRKKYAELVAELLINEEPVIYHEITRAEQHGFKLVAWDEGELFELNVRNVSAQRVGQKYEA